MIDHDLVRRYARRYANSNMLATVTVSRPSPAVLDDLTGELVAVSGEVVYSGRARIYPVNGGEQSWGDEPQHTTSTYVSIPITDDPGAAVPQVDDVVMVDVAPSDVWLTGRSFQVTNVEHGGQWTAVYRLSCSGVQDSGEWSKS